MKWKKRTENITMIHNEGMKKEFNVMEMEGHKEADSCTVKKGTHTHTHIKCDDCEGGCT
jgi:hypothetical protein